MHLFCRIVFLHCRKWHSGWCNMVQPSVLTRWPLMEMESWTARTRLKCGQWSGALRRVYLFSTEIHVQGYLPPSKVALSFIQRVEFQTNKCLYGSSNDCGPNWRGAKRTTNKFSVFAHARACTQHRAAGPVLSQSQWCPSVLYFMFYLMSRQGANGFV